MDSEHWLLPVSNEDLYPSFSTSYTRLECHDSDEVTHDFGSGTDIPEVHAQSAESGLHPTTFRVPCLQDDERLVELGNSESSLTPEFVKSYCQRILFVWRVVFHLCEENHELALRTWVQLLDGEIGDNIWLWMDGDELEVKNQYFLHSDSPSPSWIQMGVQGWKLATSDILMGISALARRMARVRSGVMESLHMVERRNRLRDVVHPSLRFASIAWSTATSQAVLRADNSRGLQRRHLLKLFNMLRDVVHLEFPSAVANLIDSIIHSEFQDYKVSMMKAGHTCQQSVRYNRWIYIKSLVTPNHELDDTLCKSVCSSLDCESYEPGFEYGSSNTYIVHY
jgi:hypothetical protein